MRREVQVIVPDACSSFNPRYTVGEAIIEPLLAHHIVSKRDALTEARRLLDLVQLPTDTLLRFPHQLSKDYCQRIAIARAIALRPRLLIFDESTATLDPAAQAQLLSLLKSLRLALKLSYLFISHNLAAVQHIADRIIVMQTGKIIERGTTEEVFNNPKQPYTKKLIEAIF
jgi:ABC-type glutathione transport system ATPase component